MRNKQKTDIKKKKRKKVDQVGRYSPPCDFSPKCTTLPHIHAVVYVVASADMFFTLVPS